MYGAPASTFGHICFLHKIFSHLDSSDEDFMGDLEQSEVRSLWI